MLICTTTQPHRLLPAGAHHLAAVPARPGAAQRSAGHDRLPLLRQLDQEHLQVLAHTNQERRLEQVGCGALFLQ